MVDVKIEIHGNSSNPMVSVKFDGENRYKVRINNTPVRKMGAFDSKKHPFLEVSSIEKGVMFFNNTLIEEYIEQEIFKHNKVEEILKKVENSLRYSLEIIKMHYSSLDYVHEFEI